MNRHSYLGILFSLAVTEITIAAPVLQSLEKETEVFHYSEQEKHTLLNQLYDLNANIAKIQREQNVFFQRRNKIETEIANSTQLVSHLNKEVKEQRLRLAHRLKVLNQFGGQGTLQLVFSSQSSSDLDRELRALKRIVNLDFQSFLTYRNELKDLNAQQDRLNEKQKHLADVIEQMKTRGQAIAEKVVEKNHLFSQIDSKQLLRITKMKRLRMQASQDDGQLKLARKLASLESILQPSFIENRGQLTPPFNGTLVEQFGMQTVGDHQDSIKFRSHGIAWQNAKGASVKNIYPGEVIYQGDVAGFGPTVVVDHGEHYYSVYSHLAQVNVANGQHLNAGESLGETQKLYFEIRHFSESEDPQTWLRR